MKHLNHSVVAAIEKLRGCDENPDHGVAACQLADSNMCGTSPESVHSVKRLPAESLAQGSIERISLLSHRRPAMNRDINDVLNFVATGSLGRVLLNCTSRVQSLSRAAESFVAAAERLYDLLPFRV